jgi:hypothetical protein
MLFELTYCEHESLGSLVFNILSVYWNTTICTNASLLKYVELKLKVSNCILRLMDIWGVVLNFRQNKVAKEMYRQKINVRDMLYPTSAKE